MWAFAHGVEKFRVFGRFHGDLREKGHIVGQFGQSFHELKAFLADRAQFVHPMLVALALGQRDVGQRDRIEIIVGQRDEFESLAPQAQRSLRSPHRWCRWRGFCPSVRHTEQKEQCLEHPRTVCTEAHM